MTITMEIDYQDWHAYRDHMGKQVRVVGTCVIRGGGIAASLALHEPQGINPDYLLLDLHLTPTGESSSDQPVEWIEPWLDDAQRYTDVQILVITPDEFEADPPPVMKVEDIY